MGSRCTARRMAVDKPDPVMAGSDPARQDRLPLPDHGGEESLMWRDGGTQGRGNDADARERAAFAAAALRTAFAPVAPAGEFDRLLACLDRVPSRR